MKKKKLMTVIHIAIAASVIGGALALCGCSGSNFGSAVGGGSAGSNNCVAACGGCVGGATSTFLAGFCTGCGEGCVNFF